VRPPLRELFFAVVLVSLMLSGCAAAPAPVRRIARSSMTTAAPPKRKPTRTPAPTNPPGFTLLDTPPVVNNGPRTGNSVALTFDADMTPGMAARLESTPGVSYANREVLSILERGNVAATFFITGMWAEQYPDVMRRIASDPDFEIGNHTWTHGAYTPNCYTLVQIPQAKMASEITRTFDIIRPYGGHQTNYFRFPGLCYDAAALVAIAPTHVTVIQGDVVSGDPGATSAAPIVRAVLSKVKPGSIVVLHITEDNAPFTDEALPQILDGLTKKGLVPVRLSTLLAA
jgi:peptidoglycan/xylan/chitin deacetylase (PgdA/CDA1 family)